MQIPVYINLPLYLVLRSCAASKVALVRAAGDAWTLAGVCSRGMATFLAEPGATGVVDNGVTEELSSTPEN